MSGAKGPPPELTGFTFLESIGGGGFADVFLATQHSTGRAVAVKVLRAEHLSAASLDQFQVEANVMAGVSAHPYIVTIHDAGVAADGRPYIIMEHYPQPHFGTRSRGGRLGVAEVLKVGVQVAAAVETAHRAEIIHRDIKPANILTSAFGDPGLTDFGIAGVQADGALSAATGVSLGFAAPEVVLDEQATGSRLSDVYSLAATLYALLSGHSPVYIPGGDNSTGALTQRVAAASAQPLRREDAPPSLRHLLNAALDADPSHRPPSAAQFGQALQDVEQELRLPPTQLVLVGSAPPTTSPVDRTGDEEGTRRKPRVVRPEGPGDGPPLADPGPPAAGTTVHRPVVDPPTAPRDRQDAAIASGETVARRPAATAVPTEPTEPTTGAEARSSGGRRRLLVGGAVAAAVVIVGGALALGQGGGSSSTTTTIPETLAQDPVGAGTSFVGPPESPAAAFTGDGSLAVSWSPPTDVDDPDQVTYQVQQSGGDDGGTILADAVTGTSASIEGLDPATETCVAIYAMVDDVISTTPSPEACAGG